VSLKYNNCTFYTAHFNFTTAQIEIVINCTLKYAMAYVTVSTTD